MKEYQAIAMVFAGNYAAARFESGWWSDKAKAQAELRGILVEHIPAGCYQIGQQLKTRKAIL